MSVRTLLRTIWRSRTGPLLVCFQVAVALVVLVNVAYLVAVRVETTGRETGMDIDSIVWIRTEGYGADYDHNRAIDTDLRYLKAMPEVISASVANALPQTFTGMRSELSTELAGGGTKSLAILYQGTSELADTLGLRLEEGRLPAAVPLVAAEASVSNTRSSGGEIVVTRALAQSLFGNQNALGKTVYLGTDRQSATVVGVVEQMQAAPFFGPGSEFVEQVALSAGVPAGPAALYLVRAQPGRRNAVLAAIERTFESIEPQRYVNQVESFARTAQATRAPARASAIFSAIVAILVAAVTALGLFGLASYNVTTRTQDIGIRRALGARRSDILRMFLLENWLIVSGGLLIGAVLTIALAIPLTGLLRMARLPLVYLGIGIACMWVLGLAAAFVPACRAASVPPAVATRAL